MYLALRVEESDLGLYFLPISYITTLGLYEISSRTYIFMTMKPVLAGICILLQNVSCGTWNGKKTENGDMRVL